MKRFIMLIVGLFVSGSILAHDDFTHDFSGVGTHSVEINVDYAYARANGVNFSGQEALVGAQVNAGGLGSVYLGAGDRQKITSPRSDVPVFTVGYANGVKLGPLGLVAAANYALLETSPAVGNVITLTGEANLALRYLKPMIDYAVSRTSSRSDPIKGVGNVVEMGSYVNLGSQVVLKIGYTRAWASTLHTNGVAVSINYVCQ
jgi:hypothetical protein